MDYSHLPGPVITISASATTICQGTTVTLTASGSSGYTWASSTGGSYSGSPIAVAPNVTTTYTVTGVSGTCPSDPQNITITVKPTPDFNIGGDVVLCEGDAFPYLCPSITGRGNSYSWAGPGITSGSETSSCFQTLQVGTYCLTVTNALGCSTTKCVMISEDPRLSFDLDFSLDVSCNTIDSYVTVIPTYNTLLAGLSQLVLVKIWNGTSWSAYHTGTTFNFSLINFDKDKLYQITRMVWSTDGCYSLKTVAHTFSCTANKRRKKGRFAQVDSEVVLNDVRDFNIYPNPNNGQFNIAIDSDESTLIEVYDLMGKQVFNSKMNETIKKIDISDQPKGIYLVRITIGNNVFNEKIVYQ